jgi:nucleotide-binding universal stress UspA family protein
VELLEVVTAPAQDLVHEAPSPEAIVAAARRTNVPADAVVEGGSGTPGFAGRLEDWAKSAGPS